MKPVDNVRALRPRSSAVGLGVLCAALLATLGTVAPARAAKTLDPARPEDALLLNRKMTCTLEDGKPIIQ